MNIKGPINIDGLTSDGESNLQDNLLIRAEIKDYSETVNPLGSISGATTIDLTLGNIITATITDTTTWTFSNPSASGKGCSFTLILTNGGAFSQVWPTPNTKWAGGTPPTLTASGVDVLTFFTIDAGTTWIGNISTKDAK